MRRRHVADRGRRVETLERAVEDVFPVRHGGGGDGGGGFGRGGERGGGGGGGRGEVGAEGEVVEIGAVVVVGGYEARGEGVRAHGGCVVGVGVGAAGG